MVFISTSSFMENVIVKSLDVLHQWKIKHQCNKVLNKTTCYASILNKTIHKKHIIWNMRKPKSSNENKVVTKSDIFRIKSHCRIIWKLWLTTIMIVSTNLKWISFIPSSSTTTILFFQLCKIFWLSNVVGKYKRM